MTYKKRDALQKMLDENETGWVYGEAVDAALEEAYEEGFDEGVDHGVAIGREQAENKTYLNVDDAKKRLHYLRHGGEWQRDTEGDPYVAGFQDALKTLGVFK